MPWFINICLMLQIYTFFRGWMGIWFTLLRCLCGIGQTMAWKECLLHGFQCTILFPYIDELLYQLFLPGTTTDLYGIVQLLNRTSQFFLKLLNFILKPQCTCSITTGPNKNKKQKRCFEYYLPDHKLLQLFDIVCHILINTLVWGTNQHVNW